MDEFNFCPAASSSPISILPAHVAPKPLTSQTHLQQQHLHLNSSGIGSPRNNANPSPLAHSLAPGLRCNEANSNASQCSNLNNNNNNNSTHSNTNISIISSSSSTASHLGYVSKPITHQTHSIHRQLSTPTAETTTPAAASVTVAASVVYAMDRLSPYNNSFEDARNGNNLSSLTLDQIFKGIYLVYDLIYSIRC